ncbi:MAG: DUF2917 domain-containing protein [Burkholderiaceae bacterium]|jgi:hypothetical protein
MKINLPSLYLTLRASEPVTIVNAENTVIRVIEGRVWITEEGVTDDSFLFAGSQYQVRTGGRVVLDSDSLSRIEVLESVAVRTQPAFAAFAAHIIAVVKRLVGTTGGGGRAAAL